MTVNSQNRGYVNRSSLPGRSGSCQILLLALILLAPGGDVRAELVADGVTLTRLSDDGRSRAVSWAFHGDLIAFVREETGTQKQLMIMKADGTAEVAVTQIGNPFFAQWSWAGKKLSYEFSNAADSQSQGGVFIYDVLTKRSLSISPPYLRSAIDPDDGPFFSADDKLVVYKVRPGAARKRQLWVADTQSGQIQRLLAERGQGKEQRWSPSEPHKICLLIEGSGGHFEIATVNPDGSDFAQLTDIGSQSIRADTPRWSPTGEWVAFTSSADMTQAEHLLGRNDCWVARPDGTGARNLTNATSTATEEQLYVGDLLWSWDGRWILAVGYRFDIQGNGIQTVYLIDPMNGGYQPIMTSYPRKTGEIDQFMSTKWSYDSTKILLLINRHAVKNWGPEYRLEAPRQALSIYDFREERLDDILAYDVQLDRKEILGLSDRDRMDDISWSPDSGSILLTIATVVSKDDGILRPDVYRLDLPQRFVDPSGSRHIGPSMGRPDTAADTIAAPVAQVTAQNTAARQPNGADSQGNVTEAIEPLHMTVAEAMESLPSVYDKYTTVNATRNMILFKGPSDVLANMKTDLYLIDTDPPHVLVDLLAVELSEEANRSLGLDWSYAEGRFALFQPVGKSLQKFSQTTDQAGLPAGALDTLSSLTGVGQIFYQGVGALPSEFFIRLNTLVKDGEGTILANPRTVAMSGKESLIQIRKTLNYFYSEGIDYAGRPVSKKSDISADTEGRITPTLLSDGRIHLVVDVGVGSFTFTGDAGLPEQTVRKSTTEVTVEQGQTIVLGGLRQQEISNTVAKVPCLGDIPFLGRLFRHDETATKHSVLTIFITPHVLRRGEPVPEWPELNGEGHTLVPIMEKPHRTKPG